MTMCNDSTWPAGASEISCDLENFLIFLGSGYKTTWADVSGHQANRSPYSVSVSSGFGLYQLPEESWSTYWFETVASCETETTEWTKQSCGRTYNHKLQFSSNTSELIVCVTFWLWDKWKTYNFKSFSRMLGTQMHVSAGHQQAVIWPTHQIQCIIGQYDDSIYIR